MEITFERFKNKFAEEIDEFVEQKAELCFALDEDTKDKISAIFTKELIAQLFYDDASIIFTAAKWGTDDTPVQDAWYVLTRDYLRKHHPDLIRPYLVKYHPEMLPENQPKRGPYGGIMRNGIETFMVFGNVGRGKTYLPDTMKDWISSNQDRES